MTVPRQLQLPKPSLAWTVPPDLGPDETRWRRIAIVPGSKRDLPGGGLALDVEMIGWVRGRAILPSPWGLCQESRRERLEQLKANWARSEGEAKSSRDGYRVSRREGA